MTETGDDEAYSQSILSVTVELELDLPPATPHCAAIVMMLSPRRALSKYRRPIFSSKQCLFCGDTRRYRVPATFSCYTGNSCEN